MSGASVVKQESQRYGPSFFEFDSFEFLEFDSSLTAELWMSYRWEKNLMIKCRVKLVVII